MKSMSIHLIMKTMSKTLRTILTVLHLNSTIDFKQYKEDYSIYERAQKYFEENPVGVASPVGKPQN